jgi:FixJ family two-component response regulator
MTSAIEKSNTMQQVATVLRQEQQVALELLVLGHSDRAIAQALGVRRETIWRWKHRDPAF